MTTNKKNHWPEIIIIIAAIAGAIWLLKANSYQPPTVGQPTAKLTRPLKVDSTQNQLPNDTAAAAPPDNSAAPSSTASAGTNPQQSVTGL